MKISSIFNRIYSDYFMPCRLSELRLIYSAAKSESYEFHSVISFYDEIKNVGLDPNKKYFISRCDVDTDVETAKLIFALKQSYSVKSSFYFRLSTIDQNFMREIHVRGSEASYHFEEIASLAKKYMWRDKSDIDYELVSRLFEYNFSRLKNNTDLPMRSVCSHGDFVNRILGVMNHEFLNARIRKNLNIELETYDEWFMNYVRARHCDTGYPQFYTTSSPMESINEGVSVIYFLTHPRHWRVNRLINSKDNFIRLCEGLSYISK